MEGMARAGAEMALSPGWPRRMFDARSTSDARAGHRCTSRAVWLRVGVRMRTLFI